MRVVLLSHHYLESKRRAGFHWLAHSYRRQGHEVLFCTVSISWLSVLRRDFRLEYPVRAEAGRLRRAESGIQSYVWWTGWHPAHLRSELLNRLSMPLFRRYGRSSWGEMGTALRDADLVIFESTPALAIAPAVRRMNPTARMVYRVSDDIRQMRMHPVVEEFERAAIPHFDLVSLPGARMYALFQELYPGTSSLRLQYHGLEKHLFDTVHPNPYDHSWERHAVFVGNSRFDHDFLERASAEFPNVAFHIIGPIKGVRPGRNRFVYGELPFAKTIGFVQHADLGLHTLSFSAGADCFGDSLKALQYSYCGLPIVAPEFLRTARSNVHYYVPGDGSSVKAAVDAALAAGKSYDNRSSIWSWDELARALAGTSTDASPSWQPLATRAVAG